MEILFDKPIFEEEYCIEFLQDIEYLNELLKISDSITE